MSEHAALLLTDIVDSTKLGEALGDAAMSALWTEHDRLARDLLREWRGREIDKSDGFLLLFAEVGDAVGYAHAYHRALAGLHPPIDARAGVHAGPVITRANPAEDVARGAKPLEVEGSVKPITARVMSLARGGQTLLTGQARAALAATDLHIRSHGHWRLKGVAEPIELFEAGDEQSRFLPPEDGDKGYRVVREQENWRPVRDVPNSLPAERDTFIGRSAELRRLADLLHGGARLVSVIGLGGMGKTRVVIHFARRWLGEFAGGVWFCDLSEARDADGIYSAVAQGLNMNLGRSDPRARLAEVISGRGRCLVILDNFEQVTALAADTLGHWLDRAPQALFITTTRERLAVPGEQALLLDPLALPDAAGLFVRRGLSHQPYLRLGDDEARAIDRLVDLLDRLPLAIELAAGRLSLMTPQAMLARIGQRFQLLSGRGGRPKRQSTLRAAFDWSWELLTPVEQRALAQISVFAGGFTLEAAENVLIEDVTIPAPSVFDVLASLVDKSLLRATEDRFVLLVSVREYAASKLVELAASNPSLASAAVEARHGIWFAHTIPTAVRRDEPELENILVGARRAIERGDASIVAPLSENAWKILKGRGPVGVATELAEAALAMPTLSPPDRVRLVHIHGRCLLLAGAPKRAREQLLRAHAGAGAEGLKSEELNALSSLAELNLIEGQVDEARRQYEEAIKGAERLGDDRLLCAALNGLGGYFDHVGQFRLARDQFQEALEIARRTGDRFWEGGALNNLGLMEANLGNRAMARVHNDAAIAVARELGDRVWEGNLLCNLGLLNLEDGDTESARDHLGRSLLLAREGGLSQLESIVLCNMGLLHESLHDDAAADAAYRDALRVARRRGDQRSQGQFLGYLGLVVARSGDPAQGRDLLREGIGLLRGVKDRPSLAIALCRYARGCALWGDAAGGMTLLDEASTIAAELGVATGAELALALEAARRALEQAPALG